MENYIIGKIEKIIFKSDKGYHIGVINVSKTNLEIKKETVTFTGFFHEIKYENNYKIYIKEIEHVKYGEQYEVIQYEMLPIDDKESLIEFFSSSLFPGIGEVKARKIVQTLGEDAIKKINEDPLTLNLVQNISQNDIGSITRNLKKHNENHEILVLLTKTGFKMKDSIIIYNKIGAMALSVIENNIYDIINMCDINYTIVDNIGKKLYKETDERRVSSTILHVLKEVLFNKGDTYLYIDEITESMNRFLGFVTEEEEVNRLAKTIKEITIKQNMYFLTSIYNDELHIGTTITKLNKIKPKQIELIELDDPTNKKISYNQDQQNGIKNALVNQVSIITGGPGTGKTTIVKAIVKQYAKLNKLDSKQLQKKVALLTPTGRASKRLTELTGFQAITIHRFLKWNKDTNEFSVNEHNKEECNLVIIDEASMLDVEVFAALLKGLNKNIQIVLVGDKNQLPSVGMGQVLKDLIKSKTIQTTYLNTLYRQSEDSFIPILARQINEGELQEEWLETHSDFRFLETNSTLGSIMNICKQLIEHGYKKTDIQVLAPMYGGENGIDNLNKNLQIVFNKNEKQQIKYGYITYKVGDKIIYLINNSEDNIFNGDVGIITSLTKKGIEIDFFGNKVEISKSDLRNIKHAFAISIHKSQGSEYDIVVMPMVNNYSIMLYRKLVYTGITRAKNKLFIVGERNAFMRAIVNNANSKRKTILKQILVGDYDE